MGALDVPLSDVAQVAAVDLEHLGPAGDLHGDPAAGGPLGLHLPQGLPDAGIRVLHCVGAACLHVQRQHYMYHCSQPHIWVQEAYSTAGAQRVCDELVALVCHLHVCNAYN